MGRATLSLEQQIAGLFAVLSIALVSASLLASEHFGRQAAVQSVQNEIVAAAGHFADALDRGMFERFREVQLLARSDQVRESAAKDAGALRAIFSRRRATLPEMTWIGFATPDGTVRAASDGLLEGASVSERPWFAEGLKRPWVGDLHEAKLLAAKLGPQPNGEPFRFVDVTAPVIDQTGATLGVIGVHLSWTWAAEVRAGLLGKDRGSAQALILSNDGHVLLGPKGGATPFTDEQIAFMKEHHQGTLVSTGDAGTLLNGFATASGFRDYPGLGWIVVAQEPASIAFAPIAATSRWLMLIGLVLIAAGALAVWALARRLTRPIRALTVAANQIGRDPHATMPRLAGSREIIELSASLRALVRHVDAAEQHAHDVSETSLVSVRRFEQEISALRTVADTDPLTGLLNRRAFLTAAEDAMRSRHQRERKSAILIADIDFFKRVNDTYGHAVGDAVIQHVGNTLGSLVRGTDKVARFGGEEFVVLLREIGEESVHKLAERMREAVQQKVVSAGGSNVSVSLSIGGALVSDGDDNVHDVIERADRALYEAKAAGRNRVALALTPRVMGEAA